MKLENQVCSFELSIKLKELGVKQDSYFYWAQEGNQKIDCPDCKKARQSVPEVSYGIIPECAYCGGTGKINAKVAYLVVGFIDKGKDYSAFTVSELGEILPIGTKIVKNFDDWTVHEPTSIENKRYGNRSAESESDARAEMLIYLLEKGFIEKDKR